MNRKPVLMMAAATLMSGAFASGQSAPEDQPAPVVQPASELASSLAQRLGDELHVKTAVGEPVKVGSLTLIPIMRVDVSFGGVGLAAPGHPPAAVAPAAVPQAAVPQSPGIGGDGFFMSGEARPLGFVVVGTKGTRFISVVRTPAK
jgi:uncharacterized spore protein YtfJ